MWRSCIALCLLAALAEVVAGGTKEPTPLAADILKLTGGARTKLVWLREAKEAEKRPWSGEFQLPQNKLRGCYDRWTLMGFDTDEGHERVLVPGPASYANPCITDDGSRVVYSDMMEQKAYVMDWDGFNRRVLSQDRFYYVLCCRRDGRTGVEWAYLNDFGSAERPSGYDLHSFGTGVYRVQVDNPSVRELVWVGPVTIFRVSADGNYAGGEFSSLDQGVGNLSEKTFSERGIGHDGCLAPDNSYRLLFLDEARRDLMVNDGEGKESRSVSLTDLRPEFKGMRAAGAAWSNNARYFTLSGPIPNEGDLQRADIYLGRFDDGASGVAGLVRLTDSPAFNAKAYAWVETEPRGPEPAKAVPEKALPPPEIVAPSSEALRVQELAERDWTNSIGMKFRLIRAGRFNPQADHVGGKVVEKPFYLGVFEVTQEEWQKVMGNNPSEFKGPLLPVENVSWLDVQEFLKRLSQKEKLTYRLPTDLEWEYAYRAGTATWFYWMHGFEGRYAWALENSGGRPHEVGLRLPNSWGLYDMAGNVFEWTADSLSREEPNGKAVNHIAPVDMGKNASPIYRGGAFSSDSSYCLADTVVYVPFGLNYRSRSIGFRVVPEMKEKEAVPNGNAEEVTGSWPSNPDGVVFKWENDKSQALVYDPAGKPISNYFLMPKGVAWLNRDYGMHVENGEFRVEKGMDYILSQITETNRFSIEMTVTTLLTIPYGREKENRPVAFLGSSVGTGNFALLQGHGMSLIHGMLSIRLNTSTMGAGEPMPKVDLCYLTDAGNKGHDAQRGIPAGGGQPVHVVITYQPGLLVAYANGERVVENRSVQGDLSSWGLYPLVFGGVVPGDHAENGDQGWRGNIEGVCLYNRVLGAQEVHRNYLLYRKKLGARTPAKRLEVKAKLLAKSVILSAAEIAPYRRELAVYEYEVENLLAGDCRDKKIRVAHWVLMDGVLLAKSQAEIGKSYDLNLEPFEDNPQLESERLSETLLVADLPRYMDVGFVDQKPVDPSVIKAIEEAKKEYEAKLAGSKIDFARVASNILKLTGGVRTKIVWARCPDVWGDEYGALMGFDTTEGKERPIVPGETHCTGAYITHDGSRVIFSDAMDQTAYVVDWDGRNRRAFSAQRYLQIMCYRWAPETNCDLAYLSDYGSAERHNMSGADAPPFRIYAVEIDNPSVRKLVWIGDPPETFTVSQDGKFAGGGMPWPQQCVVNLAEKFISHRGTGCRGCIAPDNSYRFFFLGGGHHYINVTDPGGADLRKIPLDEQRVELEGHEVWRPLWSNDVRYFTMSAPGWTGHLNVYLGKFNEGMTAVAGLVQVSQTPIYDDMTCAWIEQPSTSGRPAKANLVEPLLRIASVAPSPEAVKTQEGAKADWVNSMGMKFKLVPASPSTNPGAPPIRPFYLGVFEVTQEEWQKVMGNNPSEFKGPLLPVENVSWLDAQEFLKRLSEKEKVAYRLATSAEWEYACRAGAATRYFWGDAFDGQYAWTLENAEGRPHEVGVRLPNPWGLYDMSGNVFEWTSDSAVEWKFDHTAPVDVNKKGRANPIYRGGAFSAEPVYSASAVRLYAAVGAWDMTAPGVAYRSRSIGFRVARDLTEMTDNK